MRRDQTRALLLTSRFLVFFYMTGAAFDDSLGHPGQKWELNEHIGPGKRDMSGIKQWHASARPPQLRKACFGTTIATCGRERQAASCVNHIYFSRSVPFRNACYLRPPLSRRIWCIRDKVGLRNIDRRKLLVGAAALSLPVDVNTHTSIQFETIWTTELVEPVRLFRSFPTNLLIVRHEMQMNQTIKMAAWHGPSWEARRGPPSLERQQAVFTAKYSRE